MDFHFLPKINLTTFILIVYFSNLYGQNDNSAVNLTITGNQSNRISPGDVVNIIVSAESNGPGTLRLDVKPDVPAFAVNWNSKSISCEATCVLTDTLTLKPQKEDCGIYTFTVAARLSDSGDVQSMKRKITVQVVPRIEAEPPFTSRTSNLICWTGCDEISHELFHFPHAVVKSGLIYNSLVKQNASNSCQIVENLSNGIRYGYFLESTILSEGEFITLKSDTVFSTQDDTPPPVVELSDFTVNSDGEVTIQWPYIPDYISYIEKYIVLRENSSSVESIFTVVDTIPFFPVSNITPLNYFSVCTNNEESVYLDGTEVISKFPGELKGSTLIKTAKQDRWSESENFLTFNLESPSYIYIAFGHNFISRPDWLRRYFQNIKIDLVVGSNDVNLRLFKSRDVFQKGKVILGGNFAQGADIINQEPTMYAVFIQPVDNTYPYTSLDKMSYSDPLGEESDLQSFRYRIETLDAAGNISQGGPSSPIILDLKGRCKPEIKSWFVVENEMGEQFARGSTNEVSLHDPASISECYGFRNSDSLRFQAVRENAILFDIHRPEDRGVHFFDSGWIGVGDLTANLGYEFNLLPPDKGPSFVNGLKYFYRVSGKDVDNNISVWSDTVSAVQDFFPPSDIRNLHAFTELFENEEDGSIILNWQPAIDPVSGLESYIIYRSDSGGISFSALDTLDSRQTSYSDTLSKIGINKVLNYKIAVKDRVGNFRSIEDSDWEVSLRALVAPVIVPDSSNTIVLGSGVLGISKDILTIHWQEFDNTDVAGYKIEILYPDMTKSLKTINNPELLATDCQLDGIDGLYKIRLRAFYNNEIKTVFSNTIAVRKKILLQSVENLTARQDNKPTGNIILNWSHPDSAEIVEFQVYSWTEGEDQPGLPLIVLPGDRLEWIHSFVQDSLKTYQCNYYSVKALDCFSLLSRDDPVAAQYSNRSPEFDREKTELDINNIKVCWDRPLPSLNENLSFNAEIIVYQDSISLSPYTTANLFNKTCFTLYNAEPGHKYIFQVKETILDDLNQTCANIFESAFSNLLFVPLDDCPPTVDFELQALPVQPGSSTGNIFITWHGYKNGSINKYLVQWSISGSGTVLDSILVNDQDSLLIQGLAISNTYEFVVIAIDFLNQRSFTNYTKTVSFNPKWLFTPKIQEINPSCFRDSLLIEWVWIDNDFIPVDGNSGADSVLIELSIDPNFKFYKSITRSGSGNSKTFKKDTDYPFVNSQNNILYARIRAKDHWNHLSPWSTEYSELGMLSAHFDDVPPGIATSYIDSTQAPIFGNSGEINVHLRWNEVRDNCSGTWFYEITRNNNIIARDTSRAAVHYLIDRNVSTDDILLTSQWRVHAVDSLGNRQEIAKVCSVPFFINPPQSGWCVNDSTFSWTGVSLNDSSQKIFYFVEGARFVELFGNVTTNIGSGPLEKLYFNFNVPWDNIFWRVKARVDNFESPWSTTYSCLLIPESAVTSTGHQEMEYLPEEYELNQNYPNPFNPETTIRYAIPKYEVNGVKVVIELFNMAGQKVRKLVHDYKQPGEYIVVWDGRDDNGLIVGNGIYVYRMQVRNFISSHKMIFLK